MGARKFLLCFFALVLPMMVSAQFTFFPDFPKHKKVKLKVIHLTDGYRIK